MLSSSFLDHFQSLEDPRSKNHRNKLHKLEDMLVITILASICSADNWVDIVEFGKSKMPWLKTFLELPHGIPSHDTFSRIFSLLNPAQLQSCFLSWTESIYKKTNNEIIAIDGKTLRRSYDKEGTKGAIHMVSAWAVHNKMVLSQVKTDDHSNEITAIPKLIDALDLKGTTVTIDAMGCQQSIAEKIISNEADYVLSLKGNQGNLYESVRELFLHGLENNFKRVQHNYYEDITKDHGRLEVRKYWLINKNEESEATADLVWPGLKSVGMSECSRYIKGKESTEYRFYLLSFTEDAQRFSEAARGHWNVEVNLHWSLDVSFNEDQNRSRIDNSAENLAVIRHIALNALKKEKSKIGISAKRKKAGWSNSYLRKILGCL